jgi:hypothetical protein
LRRVRLKGFAPAGRSPSLPLSEQMRSPRVASSTERLLVPVLRPGDIVILDNLGSHRAQAIRDAILSCSSPRCDATQRQLQNRRRHRPASEE